jgi:glycosyltransferase involved in cell wall biosynthesis
LIRVLQVNSARAFGGGERHLADLARGLHERGHQVSVALREGSPLRSRLSFLPERNVYTLPLRNSLDLGSARKLARIARERGVDVIHAHVARDYAPASLAARLAPASRLVITRHVLFPLSGAHRLALSNVARVIAVSEPVARALRAQKIFDEDKLRVVENSVNLARFEHTRAASDAPDRPFRVGIVGELSEVKGQLEFVRAAALVAGEFGDRVEFIVVGEDNSRGGEYRARVEGLLDELSLRDRVRLTGQLSEDAAAGLVASLDILVSASHSEAFGMAMAEALACGVPVVATATEGAQSLIEEGVNGLLVPAGDVRALAAAVSSLLSDEQLRLELGVQARRSARERFSPERMVEATVRVYEEALGKTGQYRAR